MPSNRMSVDDTSADLVVIGLGAMGSATADAAARLGHTVIGLEAFAQGHSRGSSHGPTRMLRRSVEEGPQYVPLILDALPRWAELNDDARSPVTDLRGAIRIAPTGSPLHASFVASAVALGLEYDQLTARGGQRPVPGVLGARGVLGDVRARSGRALRRSHRACVAGPGEPPRRRRCTSTSRSCRGNPTATRWSCERRTRRITRRAS